MKLPLVTPHDGNEDNAAHTPAENKQTLLESTVPLPSSPALFRLANPEDFLQEKKRRLSWQAILVIVVLALLLAVYIGFSVFFMNHFTFNSTVNGVPVAFKTVEEVNDNLAREISRYSLNIEARENTGATITASQIELRHVDDGRMEHALADQQPWAWPLALFSANASNIQHVSVDFDQQKLKNTLSAYSFMKEDQMRQPVNASLVFEGNTYVISGDDEGTTLDAEKTAREIADAIYAGETTLDLEELDVYERPTVPGDDPSLAQDRDRFNQYVPFRIEYILGDKREVLDGYTTINWVNTEGEAPYYLDINSVVAWVADLAYRYDTLEGPRNIVNGFGEEKYVEGGTFGWMLDQESECWAIMNAAEYHQGEIREPYWLNWGATFGENDWGSTYLEVDISNQYMWYFVDGVCVLETDVITGNPNTGYSTPQGVWYIFYKDMYVTTRGDRLPDGSYEWEVPVTYWMPFTPSGCGFHDAYWQPSFGGSYYLWRGSHGCINMPPYLAEELYSMLEPGTPVITHY